jgi:hypothetical protein
MRGSTTGIGPFHFWGIFSVSVKEWRITLKHPKIYSKRERGHPQSLRHTRDMGGDIACHYQPGASHLPTMSTENRSY